MSQTMPQPPNREDSHYIPKAAEMREMTVVQLRELQDTLEERLLGIKLQLDDPNEDRDEAWTKRAEAAELIVASRLNTCNRILGDKRRASPETDSRAARWFAFVKVAEKLLKPETVQQIWQAVEAKKEAGA